MSTMTPGAMARTLSAGLLSFPVTHFKADLSFDEHAYRSHCDWLLQHGVTGLFAAGGTGEYFSLTPAEVSIVARAAVEETRGRVPVVVGCGHGTASAVEQARAAEKAGADGILLLPPYLMTPSQAGLAAHIEAVCRATSLGVIAYSRDNGIVNEQTLEQLCERCPNLVGFKDGVGDIELMMKIVARLGERLIYIGGLPTAETFALAYQEMGVSTYSSAIFNFLPEWALAFYRAVQRRDKATVMRELRSSCFRTWRSAIEVVATRSRSSKPDARPSVVPRAPFGRR
jgi:5-dehydro-4-deoxyglucarate dehydratase